MEALDKEWIFHGNIQQCEQFEKTPNTLGLKNMAGVFILVGAGIIGGKFDFRFWIFNGYILKDVLGIGCFVVLIGSG